MRKLAMTIASAGIAAGALLGAQGAHAASVDNSTNSPPKPVTPVPIIIALNCAGWTGAEGCGPGWFWRDGWWLYTFAAPGCPPGLVVTGPAVYETVSKTTLGSMSMVV